MTGNCLNFSFEALLRSKQCTGHQNSSHQKYWPLNRLVWRRTCGQLVLLRIFYCLAAPHFKVIFFIDKTCFKNERPNLDQTLFSKEITKETCRYNLPKIAICTTTEFN